MPGLPKNFRLWFLAWCCWWSVHFSLYFTVLSPAAVLFSVTLKSLHLYWSPHCLGGLQWCGFLFSFTAPSQDASPVLILFLSLSLFSSTQFCQEFLALFGGLSFSNIQQMFCAWHFTCGCAFLVFVGEGEHNILLLCCLDLVSIAFSMLKTSSWTNNTIWIIVWFVCIT